MLHQCFTCETMYFSILGSPSMGVLETFSSGGISFSRDFPLKFFTTQTTFNKHKQKNKEENSILNLQRDPAAICEWTRWLLLTKAMNYGLCNFVGSLAWIVALNEALCVPQHNYPLSRQKENFQWGRDDMGNVPIDSGGWF